MSLNFKVSVLSVAPVEFVAPLVKYIFFTKPEYQLFPISHQSSREEMTDIQAMFNATRPWLLLKTVT